jgi:hypothetical protein
MATSDGHLRFPPGWVICRPAAGLQRRPEQETRAVATMGVPQTHPVNAGELKRNEGAVCPAPTESDMVMHESNHA